MTQEQVRALLVASLPPGARELYGLDDRGSDPAKFMDALAAAVKVHGLDQLDQLRTDLLPLTTANLLAEWEKALGFEGSKVSLFGSDDGRRAQNVSRLREFGASTIPNITAALAAVTGNTASIEILEHSRAAVTALNKVAVPVATVGPLSSVTVSFRIRDNAPASQAGLQFRAAFDVQADPANVSITLTPPSGATLSIDPALWPTATARVVFWKAFAGRAITGVWSLTIGNGDPVDSVELKPGAYVLVEGIGRNAWGHDGLGAAIFRWAAAINEAQTTPATYDRQVARQVAMAVVRRANPVHCCGGLALYQTDGTLCALADDPNCIADLCVAC